MAVEYKVVYHPLWEFLYAMAILASDEEQEIEEACQKLHKEEYWNCFCDIKQEMTDYMKSELQFYFADSNTICDGIGQIIMHNMLVEHTEWEKPEQLIDGIRDADNLKLTQILASNAYYEVKSQFMEEQDWWEQIQNNPEELCKTIEELKFEKKERKERFLQCMKNTDELKLRLSMLLEVFLSRSLRTIFESLPDKMQPFVQKYQREVDKDPSAFFRKYFVSGLPKKEGIVWIDVSYFRMLSGDFWGKRTKGSDWHILGCYAKEYEDSQVGQEHIFGFLKAIGEKNRLQIIELLRKDACYVNEIAEKMKMTAPTVSYHLTQLQTYGIVDYERYDHRYYYHLNLDKLEEWLEKVKEYYRTN